MPNVNSLISTAFGLALVAMPGAAQEVWIDNDTPFVELEINEEFILIERNQDTNATISGTFAKTSRPCPPFCIQPMSIADGVQTLGELELISFLQQMVQTGEGILIDSRPTRLYSAGTIPGSINLPFNLLNPEESNPFSSAILQQLGGEIQSDGNWRFNNPRTLAMYCNGPWCDQTPRAINNLLAFGYPAEKILYYRGGIQNWLMLGFTVVEPPT